LGGGTMTLENIAREYPKLACNEKVVALREWYQK
jgi:hypothetical protein